MNDQDPIQTMQEVAALFFRKLRGTIDSEDSRTTGSLAGSSIRREQEIL